MNDGARPVGKWLRVRRSLRESRFRVARASKTELLLDVLNATALVYQVWVAVNLGLSRIQDPPTVIHAVHAWVFPVALTFSTLHRVWLKEWFQNPKWAAAEAHRAEALGVAISRLAACSQANAFSGVDAGAIEQGLLGAMLSEVESIVVDKSRPLMLPLRRRTTAPHLNGSWASTSASWHDEPSKWSSGGTCTSVVY